MAQVTLEADWPPIWFCNIFDWVCALGMKWDCIISIPGKPPVGVETKPHWPGLPVGIGCKPVCCGYRPVCWGIIPVCWGIIPVCWDIIPPVGWAMKLVIGGAVPVAWGMRPPVLWEKIPVGCEVSNPGWDCWTGIKPAVCWAVNGTKPVLWAVSGVCCW